MEAWSHFLGAWSHFPVNVVTFGHMVSIYGFRAKAKILSRQWQDFCFVFFILKSLIFIIHFPDRIF